MGIRWGRRIAPRGDAESDRFPREAYHLRPSAPRFDSSCIVYYVGLWRAGVYGVDVAIVSSV
eukprot:11210686-Lingulodinium_polyedra.AAC.1